MLNIPQRWRDALTALQDGGFPEAIIAGGALRDLDNGAPVKDVDIFVKWRSNIVEDLATLQRALPGYEGIDETQADPDYQAENTEVAGVFGFYDGTGSLGALHRRQRMAHRPGDDAVRAGARGRCARSRRLTLARGKPQDCATFQFSVLAA